MKSKFAETFPDKLEKLMAQKYPDRKAKTESERELKVYDSESKQETTYSVRPHIRKAHWHLYWTGPGKSIPKTKWILPIFVKGGSADIPTVIRPVKK